ncbi:LOW QUALITY PROTEIN: dehydrogenase/reductase SDR family member FEY-like [Phoenix dactylifera]|uniref:LOW QUALITY PROTEIN: dehydrogenase/reductase SDR family member FEY-like n=1 Tax=Phoenix dactylifera TaxID=42345 RepID=A0A8B7CPS4_PHODC|nr:LOW QUALITY PROTEIN: dehydrogenase/reductase SDR family member FEY-like [Phoenix dactylifera]
MGHESKTNPRNPLRSRTLLEWTQPLFCPPRRNEGKERAMGSPASSSSSSSGDGDRNTGSGWRKKEDLGWIEWARGWCSIVGEFLFQRIAASHLENPLPLPPLDGITCIVTGATSGIGLEIARQLAHSGAHVVMAVRKTKLAHELIQKWQNENAGMGLPLNVEVMELDLLSLDSVVRFAEAWNARLGPLHALINNAGIFTIGEPQRFSKDGYEEHMQVNHLAPALLSMLLLPSLLRGSPSRIINVNSIMHAVGFVDTEDMNLTSGKRKYTSYLGYSNSKLAQVKFSSILHKRIPAEAGISVVCVSPGIVHTNVARDLPRVVVTGYRLIPYFIFDAQEGSRSTLFAATDPQVPEYCGVLKADEWPVCAYISHDWRPMNASEEAHNLETSQEVWEKTLDMIGLPSDALERLIEGEEIQCRYGSSSD